MSDLQVCPSELGLGRLKDHSLTGTGNGATHLKSQETEVGRSVWVWGQVSILLTGHLRPGRPCVRRVNGFCLCCFRKAAKHSWYLLPLPVSDFLGSPQLWEQNAVKSSTVHTRQDWSNWTGPCHTWRVPRVRPTEARGRCLHTAETAKHLWVNGRATSRLAT